VNILEMKHISAILGYVLYVRIDVVDGLSAIFKFIDPLFIIQHKEIGLYSGIRVNPHINKSVDLFSGIFPLLWVLLSLYPMHSLALAVGKVLVVLYGFCDHGFFVMI
jgi:hypothetical protein